MTMIHEVSSQQNVVHKWSSFFIFFNRICILSRVCSHTEFEKAHWKIL